MKTIEVKEIELTQDQDRFKVESYPTQGIYLVKQNNTKGLGFTELFLVLKDIVLVLNPNIIDYVKDSETKTKPKTDVPQLNNQLTESFVLELVKIISNK